MCEDVCTGSAGQQLKSSSKDQRREQHVGIAEPLTELALVLSMKHRKAQPNGPANQDVWPSVDEISISGNQGILDPMSRCYGVTDKASP